MSTATLIVRHHEVDWDGFAEAVQERRKSLSSKERSGCVYLNPEVTLIARHPSPAFAETMRRFQGRWCRRMRKTFGKWTMSRASNWSDPSDPNCGKTKRYFHRMHAFSGVLIVAGRVIPPNRWGDVLSDVVSR